jgi:hypothetical protein
MNRAASRFAKDNFEFIASYSDTTNATTYTFSNCNIGSANANRYVVVIGSGYSGNVLTSRTISSVTIGGNSATIDYTPNTAAAQCAAKLLVTTGNTANIVVTCSGSMANYLIAVYVVYGLSSTTPVNTQTGNSNPATLTMTTTAGGVMFGAMTVLSSSGGSTITGLTVNYVTTLDSTATVYGGVSRTSGSSATITFNDVGSAGARRYFCISYF